MTNDYLANRYGKNPAKARNQRILWTAVGAILVVTFFTWALIVNFGAPSQISGTIQNFTVNSAIQTTATVTVSNPDMRNGTCAVRVLNEGFFIVGYKEVAIPAALGKSATISTSINTTMNGVSASIDRCWFK